MPRVNCLMRKVIGPESEHGDDKEPNTPEKLDLALTMAWRKTRKGHLCLRTSCLPKPGKENSKMTQVERRAQS